MSSLHQIGSVRVVTSSTDVDSRCVCIIQRFPLRDLIARTTIPLSHLCGSFKPQFSAVVEPCVEADRKRILLFRPKNKKHRKSNFIFGPKNKRK